MVPVTLLSNVSLFQGLGEAQLQQLASVGRLRKAARGEHLFLEGEPLEPVFQVLLAGTIEIVRTASEGKETLLRLVQGGEPFAWAALMQSGRAPGTARTMTACEILELPQDALLALLGQEPKLALKLLVLFAERLREQHDRLHAISSERARTRLAMTILRHQPVQGRPLAVQLPHRSLAKLAGLSYEETVRLMGAWTHAEPPLLAYERGGRITVLDLARLEAAAEGQEV